MIVESKFKYKYEDRTYEIYLKDDGNFYVNHVRLDCDIDKILDGLNSEHENEVENTKKLVAKLYQEGDQKIIEWTHKRYKRYKNKFTFEDFSVAFLCIFPCLFGLAIVGGVLYLIFQLWWIFIGDSIFNGPFQYTTEEAIGLTILFFIALICVLSDVILRIMRGHF